MTMRVSMMIVLPVLAGWVNAAEVPPGAVDRGGYYEIREWTDEVEEKKVRQAVRERLVILNARGDRFAGVQITGDEFNQIEGFRAAVYNADGKKVYDKKLKDMLRTCGFGPSFMLYSSTCTYYLDLPGPAYPYTIEYEYGLRSNSLFFLNGAALQSYLPVQRAVYQLTAPNELPVHYKVHGLEVEPQVEEDGKKTVYRFEAVDVPPIPNEEHVPPEVQYPGRVAVSPHEFRLENSSYSGFSWREVGNWYRSLAADRYLGTEQAAPAGVDLRRLAREAYEQVVGETRYVAVSIGIGGWQPHAASETQQLGYGDCKDMTTLLVSYLREAGVEAYPVLIATRGAAVIDPEFPSFDFNHVITAAIIEGDTIWMDPTCNLCPFGQLPDPDQGVPVLLVTDTGGVMIRTPEGTAEENCCVRRTSMVIGEDYRVNLSAEWELSGVPALWLEQMFAYSDGEERRRALERLLASENGGYKVAEVSVARRPADSGGGAVLRLVAVSERPIDLVRGVGYVSPAVYRDLIDVRSLDLEKREYPVFTHFAQQMKDEVTISWPTTISVMSAVAPAADSLACAHGYWRRAAAVGENSVQVTVEAAGLRSLVAVSELPIFAEYMRARQAKEREPVRLITAQADQSRE